jgi:hypothetical protein
MAIQQKLHTKLVQKLILTPSLQQAIKLLPMSTLELSDCSIRRWWRTRCSRRSPPKTCSRPRPRRRQGRGRSREAKERRPTPGTTRTTSTSSATTSTTATGRGAAGGQGTAADREHALDWQFALRPPAVAALAPDRRRHDARDRHRDHRQPRRRRLPGGVGGRDRRDGSVVDSTTSSARCGRAHLRPDRRGRARPAGVPAAADPAPRARGTPTERIVTEHLRLLQNHQVPELARKLGLPIEDLKQHIEVIQHLDPKPGSRYNPRSRSTSSPTSTS